MPKHQPQSRSVAAIAEAYVVSRRRAAQPISTAEAVRAIRYVLPACEHTDRELVEIVATCAIRHGRNVAFDPMVETHDLFRLPELAAVAR